MTTTNHDPPETHFHLHVHIHQGDATTDHHVTSTTDPQALKDKILAGSLGTMSPVQLLGLAGVRNPLQYASRFPADRIRAAVRAALARPRKNIGGWVATALTKEWNFD